MRWQCPRHLVASPRRRVDRDGSRAWCSSALQTTALRSLATAHRIRTPGNVEEGLSSVIFTVKDEVGSLSQILSTFQKHGVSLSHIESRPNKGAYVYTSELTVGASGGGWWCIRVHGCPAV